MAEILRLDPCNTALKLEVTKKLFSSGDINKAFTEFMRFEALVEAKFYSDPESNDSLKLKSELE